MVNVDKTTRSYFSVHVHGQRCVREVMTIFQAEMIFDGLREDKGEYTGGIPQCMLRMSRVPQTTKQGAKYARPFVSVTTKYHYDLMGHLISETNTTTNQTIDYIYLGDQPLAMIRPTEQVYYYHNDHLGTPQAMTNASGAVAWKAAYNAFGNATMITETITNNLRFPGQYYDAETGLHYNWNRYYDPMMGRYVTADPIGLAGGINLFSYVAGNPVNSIDPFGLLAPPMPGHNPDPHGGNSGTNASGCPKESCWERYWEEVEKNRVPGAGLFGLPTGFISGSLTALSFAGPWAGEKLAQRGATGAFESQRLANNGIYLKNYFPRLLSLGTAARLVGKASLIVTVFYVSADITTLAYTGIVFDCKD